MDGSGYKDGREVKHPVSKLNSVLFALEGLRGSVGSEIISYRSLYGDQGPKLKAICVAGRGYWYESHGSWLRIGGSEEGDDVLAFLGGVINTYKRISASRGWQALGNYIIAPPADFHAIASGTKPTLLVQCANCSNRAVIYFDNNPARDQDWPAGFVGPDPCPKCGSQLRAPAGRYVLTEGRFELQS